MNSVNSKSVNVLIIQEILPLYRIPIFDGIAKLNSGKVTVFSGNCAAEYGEDKIEDNNFTFVQASWKRLFNIFKVDWSAIKLRKANDIIFHVADFKFISLWLFLFLGLFSNKKIYLHGQGGYKSKGYFINSIYSLVVWLSDGYICYTHFSKNVLKDKVPKLLHPKISVCENTLDITPVQKISLHTENDIFYVGRLREGCGIDILLRAAMKSKVHVKVIGSGDFEYISNLKRDFSAVAKFYGAVFDEEQQREIAKNCMAGAYGGDSGLSIVHYMALGLPVIVHSNIHKHMGPEPSYVIDGVNGLLFSRDDVDDLAYKIRILANDKQYRAKLANAALTTFNNLRKPTMAEKIVKILELV